MAALRGISISDLIGWAPPGAQALLPDSVANFLEGLAVLDHHSMTSDDAFLHFGTVQAGSVSLPRITGSEQDVEAPELTRGVYFRLLFPRRERSNEQNVEPPPSGFTLDLVFDPIAFRQEWLTAAVHAPASGTTPAHLETTSLQRPSDEPRVVRLFARGAFRIQVDPSGSVDVSFVDFPDPFDAEISNGAVLDTWFEPEHFFFPGGLGMSVGKVSLDFSTQYSPPAVTARGQGPEWRGIAIEEATAFFPNRQVFLGIVNLGVRDLLLGHPFGLQGEVFAELGRDPSTQAVPAAGPLRILAKSGETTTELTVSPSASGGPRDFLVKLPSNGTSTVHAILDAPPPDDEDAKSETKVNWRTTAQKKGGGSISTEFFTPEFQAEPGDWLWMDLTRVDEIDGKLQEVKFDTRLFIFTAPDDSTSTALPNKIDVELPGESTPFKNVTSISGDVESLEGVKLVADPEAEGLKWAPGFESFAVTGSEFSISGLNKETDIGDHLVVLSDTSQRKRHIKVKIIDKGELYIGCEAGLFKKDRTAVVARSVKRCVDLGLFHKSGGLVDAVGQVTARPPTVGEGILAEFVVEKEPVTQKPAGKRAERVQLIFKYDLPGSNFAKLEDVIRGWGDMKPGPAQADERPHANTWFEIRDATRDRQSAADVALELTEWFQARIDEDPEARFLVVGRCDDIDSATYNKGLADRRAKAVYNHVSDIVSAENIECWGEQQDDISTSILTEDAASHLDEEGKNKVRKCLYETDRHIVNLIENSESTESHVRPNASVDELVNSNVESDHTGRLINKLFDIPGRRTAKEQNVAPATWYRRADIVVFSTRAAESESDSTPAGELGADPDIPSRTIWMPGSESSESKVPQVSPPKYNWLVQACLAWDTPARADGWDAFPNKIEASLTWVHRGVKIPGESEPIALKTCDENPRTPEFYKLKARFTHDQRTQETVYTLGLDSIGDPKGLACAEQKELASTMALAPGLLPLLEGDGVDDDGAKLVAMLAIIAFTKFFAEEGKIVIEGIEAEVRSRGFAQLEDLTLRLSVDYSVEVSWDLAIVKGTKVKLRYRNVGVMIKVDSLIEGIQDPGSLNLDTIRLVFDEVSVEVQNPGQWSFANDTLSRFLRVTAARVGTGSAWIELDLGLAVDLGVISISQATVRAALTNDGLDVDLRGLEVSIDVPGTLKGRGKLAIDPQGGLTSALDLQVIPAGVSAAASLKLLGDFFSLFVDTRFSTALPLASTGLGIYGFNGHLVVNGSRAVPAGDVIRREIAWYALDPDKRYKPEPGSWAIGLGTVIGTLPDEGFAFNAKGNLAIQVPDLSVIFGVDGQFLRKPGSATSKGEPPPEGSESLRILGLVAVSEEAVTIAMEGNYRYGKLLKLRVPVGANFPIGSDDPYFVRIGSDGFPGDPPGVGARNGEPVSVSILPDSLNLKGSAYFMVEEKGLKHLGNKPGFDFPGFAIGTGVRFELKWGGDYIGIEVLAELVAGIGFNPLTVGAGIFIDGEVFFLLLSAGIEGELVLRYVDDPNSGELLVIYGRLCAKVGFWKFKKRKCGTVQIGDDNLVTSDGKALVQPTPPSPLSGVDFVNRVDRVVASSENGTTSPPTVWPDTIPVVHFAHSVDVLLGSESNVDPEQIEGPTWIGGDDLQFAYRITNIAIRRKGGAPINKSLPSAWSFPSHRGMYPGEQDPPVGDEKRDLHLLSDYQFRWARNIVDGAATLAADPVASLGRICEPTPEPVPVCAFGELAHRISPSLFRLRPHRPSAGPFPSSFDLVVAQSVGLKTLSQSALDLAQQGLQVSFGKVVPIPQPVPLASVTGGAESMFKAAHIDDRGQHLVSLPMRCKFEAEVVEPEIVLALCRPTTVQNNPGLQCATYEDLTRDFVAQQFEHKRLRYEVIHTDRTGFFFMRDAGGHRAIRYLDQGLTVFVPEPALEVVVTLFQMSRQGDDVQPPERLRIEAFSSSGQRLATRTDTRNIFDRNRIIRIKDNSGRGIDHVVLSGGSDRSHLVRFCYTTKLDPAVQALLDEADAAGSLPVVRGRAVNGTSVNWVPTVLPQTSTGSVRPSCNYVLYKPPVDREWGSLRIGAWSKSYVSIVRACGISAEAQRQRDEAEQARQDAIEDWNNPPPKSRVLLDADTEYEVVVDWVADAWTRPLEEGAPSKTETRPPTTPSYSIPGQDVFPFRTAAEVPTLDDSTPYNEDDESEFEPRRIRKYLKRMLPDRLSPPHFTDDPARVAYSVSYVEELVSRYGRDLVVRVVRTDPPPGSQPQNEGPGGITGNGNFALSDVAIEFPSELLEAIDARVNEAVETNGCLNPRDPEGEAKELFFDLEPNAEYDLQIVAPRGENDASPPLIQKTHFRTSRFSGPRELLDGFDFTEDGPGVSLPVEMLVEQDLPNELVRGDEEFDSALVSLGLDPLALATNARLAALYLRDGTSLKFAGVLMEAPEPIERDGRLRVIGATVIRGDGEVIPLSLARANDSGSRLLLAVSEPVGLGDSGATMELRLSGAREGLVSGTRFLAASRPSLAEEMDL